ncbi:Sulfatase [Massilia sp. PDC64]|nr:LTA synthase family protein [Massilia sp. PDC64]SDD38498.1 Sulfatase [Massilia sp. PDC64]
MVSATRPARRHDDPPSSFAGKLLARVKGALATALETLPALLAGWFVLRIAETIHAGAGGIKVSVLFGPALANDLLALARYGFVVVLGAVPLALLPRRRWRVVALGVVWGVLLAVQAGLLQYHWTAGVPLGADLFGYTRAEIATTLGGRAQPGIGLVAAYVLALAALTGVLLASGRPWWPRARARAALVAALLSIVAYKLLPDHFAPGAADTEAGVDYLRNKMAYFADRSVAHVAGEAHAGTHEQAQGLPWTGKDPRYPFAHAEQTPDTLGPLFNTQPRMKPGTPPNLVFIIVEGLGRSFSGPGARFGSFTPFLDELAGRSLYFENFLAGQGRTFGVLPTVFGSLPFGANGMAALGERMPRHTSLLAILKDQGYHLNYYTGSNLEFDNQGLFLRREGVESFVSEADFKPPYQRSNYWGYDDRALMETAIAHARADARQPSVRIIQTTSTHDPFTFPDKPAYLQKVGERLAALGIAEGANPAYTAQREVFASILFADDALRLYFEQAAKLPGYDKTIFVVTGDHRLPELPMDTRIERYHVPLVVFSPMLKAPRSIKAVSSQFDIAPSLLAFLGHGYGLRTPDQVTWLGTGLDTAPTFRNLHVIPLKQTKTELSDFVSGSVYLAQGRLFALADGMRLDRATDEGALARARAQFDAFLSANRQVGSGAALAPAAGAPGAWHDDGRKLHSVDLASEAGQVAVNNLRRGADGSVEATIVNQGTTASSPFVPLLVISDAGGLELGETAGEIQTLAPGASVQVALKAKLGRLPHGKYFVSMIPSHPETGRSIGIGQYHVELPL